MKAERVITKTGNEVGYPPIGSVGTGTTVGFFRVQFVPDDDAHLPPDCPREEFEHYDLTIFDVKRA